ncbi:MAG: FAD-binding oxidoreductase [Vicinamibacterales bacterium]
MALDFETQGDPMAVSRREFLKASSLFALQSGTAERGVLVNDVHSQLNATRVREVVAVSSPSDLQRAVRRAAASGQVISIAGGRHAMGAQQFAEKSLMLDMTRANRVRSLDRARGTVDVEAGIMWPGLVDHLLQAQAGRARHWGIAQKQTGADRLTIGGALSANVHGRGLTMKPFINDVESFVLVDAHGNARTCSRTENAELFRLAIGGYGLFGAISTVKLRLIPRQKIQRVVEVRLIDELPKAFEQRIADGFTFGDFQFSVDETSDDFLRKGVFSCYRPVDANTPMPEAQRELGDEDWHALLLLAHNNKATAFDRYSKYYLSTSGQLYWSDTHQMSTYLDNYHVRLDKQLAVEHRATEMITEIYVPRPALPSFMAEVAGAFRKNGVPIVYGTVRLIEQDDESFLAWAKQPYACIIFNLHVVHTPEGLDKAGQAFRDLIDMGMKRGGRYYLTYHRHARRDQLEACYPQLVEFLRLKRKYDPDERFQSEWYRFYKTMFADRI